VTIPTTIKAMPETPANTPNPIGSTSSFFPGGSNGAGASALSGVGVGDSDDDPEEEDKGNDEDGPRLSAREFVGCPGLPGCGVAAGSGIEEISITLLESVPLGGNDTELLTLGRGTEVSVIETTGGGIDTEPAIGETVPEGTSLEVEESVPLVLVKLGGESKVEDGNSVETIEPDTEGGRLPLSGVSTHDFTSITMSTLSTTVGVRVIVHV